MFLETFEICPECHAQDWLLDLKGAVCQNCGCVLETHPIMQKDVIPYADPTFAMECQLIDPKWKQGHLIQKKYHGYSRRDKNAVQANETLQWIQAHHPDAPLLESEQLRREIARLYLVLRKDRYAPVVEAVSLAILSVIAPKYVREHYTDWSKRHRNLAHKIMMRYPWLKLHYQPDLSNIQDLAIKRCRLLFGEDSVSICEMWAKELICKYHVDVKLQFLLREYLKKSGKVIMWKEFPGMTKGNIKTAIINWKKIKTMGDPYQFLGEKKRRV